MKELIFYICGIFSCMIVWFLWAIIASKKAKEAPLKEFHIDIEKAIRENEEQIAMTKKYQAMEDQVIDQMILQWKMEYLQSQREWLFTLLGGKMEDSYVQQMSEMWKETDGSGEH